MTEARCTRQARQLITAVRIGEEMQEVTTRYPIEKITKAKARRVLGRPRTTTITPCQRCSTHRVACRSLTNTPILCVETGTQCKRCVDAGVVCVFPDGQSGTAQMIGETTRTLSPPATPSNASWHLRDSNSGSRGELSVAEQALGSRQRSAVNTRSAFAPGRPEGEYAGQALGSSYAPRSQQKRHEDILDSLILPNKDQGDLAKRRHLFRPSRPQRESYATSQPRRSVACDRCSQMRLACRDSSGKPYYPHDQESTCANCKASHWACAYANPRVKVQGTETWKILACDDCYLRNRTCISMRSRIVSRSIYPCAACSYDEDPKKSQTCGVGEWRSRSTDLMPPRHNLVSEQAKTGAEPDREANQLETPLRDIRSVTGPILPVRTGAESTDAMLPSFSHDRERPGIGFHSADPRVWQRDEGFSSDVYGAQWGAGTLSFHDQSQLSDAPGASVSGSSVQWTDIPEFLSFAFGSESFEL